MHNQFKLLSAALLIGVVALTGCKNKKDDVAATTPPPSEPPPPPVVYSVPPAPAPAPAPARAADPMPTLQPAPAPAPIGGKSAKAPAGCHATGGASGGATAHVGGSYTVQKGDTLYGIARKVYNDPKMVAAILKANPGVDANKIKVGQKLQLP
ncbi:MAG: LysM domain-containing protein [Planctomycetota bacterium]|nr:LysM domain-containing protein [Planctomycetota bacterium]